jgi:peptide/nickel transport system substrate-binding protein
VTNHPQEVSLANRTHLFRLVLFCLLLNVLACATDSRNAQGPLGGKLETYFNAPREDTLIIDRSNRLEGGNNWNPYVPGNNAGWGLSQLSDPLCLLNYGTGEIEDWMAKSFTPNEDYTIWTLKLREGITWQDGEPFTAADIVFTIRLQIDNETMGQHFAYKEWISSVEQTDPLTVVYYLTKPNVRFKLERYSDNLCGVDYFVPKHVWEKLDDPLTFKNFDLSSGLPMGTGPYRLYKVTSNETIWVRHDDWWAAKIGLKSLPAPKKVIISYGGTQEIRLATGIDNGFDTMDDITLGSYQALTKRNPAWISFQSEAPFIWPDPCARSLSLNNSVAPWDDKDMRWMLSYVMDRKQIIEIAYEGTSIMGPYPWPMYPGMKRFTDLVPRETVEKFTQPDHIEAERILRSKGYSKTDRYWSKNGDELELEIQVFEGITELERIADVYIEQLQRFGIDAVMVKLTGGTWSDNLATGNYVAQSGWQTCGSIIEPWNTLRQLRADSVAPTGVRAQLPQTNSFRWHNAEYTEIVDRISRLDWEDPELFDLTARALEIYYDELPVIPTAQSKKLVPFNTTYWANWPTLDNYYQRPVTWCPSFIGVLPEIRKAGQ